MEPEQIGTHRLHATTNDGRMNRRTFLNMAAAAAMAAATQIAAQEKPTFRTHGIVIMPTDIPGMGWPDRCAMAGIRTIALHEFHIGTMVADGVIATAAGEVNLKRASRFLHPFASHPH